MVLERFEGAHIIRETTDGLGSIFDGFSIELGRHDNSFLFTYPATKPVRS
jgi:hypothetical protein